MVFTAEKYGDDINEMFEDLPRLAREARELQQRPSGKRFNLLRAPAFIWGSNKLEGTLSQSACIRRRNLQDCARLFGET
jgi:hypothetical protein